MRGEPVGRRVFRVVVLVAVIAGVWWMANRDRGAKDAAVNDPAVLQRAADIGDAKAQTALGEMYLKGQGVPLGNAQVAELLQKAMDQGEAKAQTALAGVYLAGRGVPKDAAHAAELLQKAADQGDAQAQAFLGTMYVQGWGVPKDPEKGCGLLHEAAAKEAGVWEVLHRFCSN